MFLIIGICENHYKKCIITNVLSQLNLSKDPKLTDLVDKISQLNLLETSQLIDLLKVKLNIKDVIMPSGPSAPAPKIEVEEVPVLFFIINRKSKQKQKQYSI